MLLSDLIDKIRRKNHGLPAEVVDRAVRRIFTEMVGGLAEGGRVELRGFGIFEVRERDGGQRRNPKTGETIQVEAKRSVHWRTGKGLAKALQDSSEKES